MLVNFPKEDKDLTLTEEDLLLFTEFLSKRNKDSISINYLITYIRDSTKVDTSPDFENKIIDIISNKIKYEKSLAQEVEDYINSTHGILNSTQIENFLHLSTTKDKKNLSVILRRLAQKGILERGRKNGEWRKIERDYEVYDLKKASGEPIKGFKFPLGIEEHAKVYPKNIINVPGVTNQGKSSFAFELARMNKHLFPGPIRFMTSEAGDDEIKERLLTIYPQDVVPFQWWLDNVEFIPRNGEWADATDPDGLNIIDYVKDYEAAYNIPKYIDDVHQKLRKGVAIVVLQKDPNKQHGHGGQGTKHAPRLEIAIEFEKIKLTKVKGAIKHPPDYRHPEGIMRNFKLRGLWKFEPTSEWYYEGEDPKPSKDMRGYMKREKPRYDLNGFVKEE